MGAGQQRACQRGALPQRPGAQAAAVTELGWHPDRVGVSGRVAWQAIRRPVWPQRRTGKGRGGGSWGGGGWWALGPGATRGRGVIRPQVGVCSVKFAVGQVVGTGERPAHVSILTVAPAAELPTKWKQQEG